MRAIIERHYEILPERLQPLVPFIFEEMLLSYSEVSGIGMALERMSRRVKRRDNPLAGEDVTTAAL
jgi:acyl carrier protein phosphodiesterase